MLTYVKCFSRGTRGKELPVSDPAAPRLKGERAQAARHLTIQASLDDNALWGDSSTLALSVPLLSTREIQTVASAALTRTRRLAVILLLTLAALLVQSFGSGVWAVPDQPSLRQTIPPYRPTSTPTRKPAARRPTGAHIVLQVDGTAARLWTIVQWMDAQGDWHDVTGWRGDLDDEHHKTWWVHPRDFGTGPFRWIVLEDPHGPMLAASAPFHLPTVSRETMRVDIALVP